MIEGVPDCILGDIPPLGIAPTGRDGGIALVVVTGACAATVDSYDIALSVSAGGEREEVGSIICHIADVSTQ